VNPNPISRHPLALWYAEPLDHASASALLAAAQQRGHRCRLLMTMIARFWLDNGYPLAYEHARHHLARSAHGRALVALIHGQLLTSRRLSGAEAALRHGFDLARTLFAANDYFTVLKRHQQLAHLTASASALPAEKLADLLTIAKVIARLQYKVHTPQASDGF
jgi:hypothetical protein